MLENALKIDGWMTENELAWIAEHAKDKDVIIEVGCYKGRSTRAWLDNSNATVYAVDPWSSMGVQDNGEVDKYADFRVYDDFIKNMDNYISSHRLIIVRDKFENVQGLPKCDLIFIDGDHRYEHVKHDILKGINLVNQNGIIAGHDYGVEWWPAVEVVVNKIFGTAFNTLEHIWWTQKS